MSLFDRLSRTVGSVLDDLSLPDRLRAQLDEAEACLDRGDPGRALVLARAVRAERESHARALWLLARSHEALGEWGAAAGAWLEFVGVRDSVAARTGLARCALALGDLLTASEQLRAALEMSSAPADRNELRVALATVHEQRGRPEAAAPLLRQAVRELPERTDLALHLARVLSADGDLDGALSALGPWLDREETPSEMLRDAARLFDRRGGSDDDLHASRLWDRMLRRDPDHPEALLALARLHLRRGRLAESLPLLQHALSVAQVGQLAPIHVALAEANARCGQWEPALDALRAALALEPDRAETWLDCARAALRTGLLDEADDASARAFELAPSRPTLALRGRILIELGRVDEAREILTPLRAARMEPDELHALGVLALASGDTTEAVTLLREAALHDRTRAEVEPALERAFQLLAPPLPETIHHEPRSVAALLDALSATAAASPVLVDLAPRLNALRQQLDTPLSIAVMGEFNAGKSTLINAWVGEEMLAMGVLPTTSHINVVRWGPRRVAVLTDRDGDARELPFAEAAQVVRRHPDSIESLEFWFPHPDLRAVHFWDTPGLNAPDADHERRAREALRSADAILWLLDVHQALSASELERIAEIEGAAEKLIVVVNKIDRLGGDTDALEQVLDHVRPPLEGRCAALVTLSARDALRARQRNESDNDHDRNDDDALTRSGFSALQEQVHRIFHERAGYLKANEALRALVVLLDEGLAHARARAARFGEAARQASELRDHLDELGRAWPTHGALPYLERERRDTLRQRERITTDLDALLSPAQGIFGRRRVERDDALATLRALRERVARARRQGVEALASVMEPADTRVAATIEGIAQALGPPESRTQRGRLEAWIAETVALRTLLHERLVETRIATLEVRLDLEGAELLQQWTDPERDDERASLLQRLLPLPREKHRVQADAWGREYLGAGARLCDHVQRDLDMLALDLEHRIIRPLETLHRKLTGLLPPSQRLLK